MQPDSPRRWQGAVVVSRPRSESFHRIVDEYASTQPVICSVTVSVQTDDGKPIAAGTRGHALVRNSSFSATKVTLLVESYTKNERFVVTGQRGARQATDEYLFSDAGDGTLIKVTSTLDLREPRILQPLNDRLIARHCQRDMRRLKGLLEGTIPPNKPAAKSAWRALLVYVLIAAVLAVIWATYRSLTS
jgi:hypothetical protein